MIITSLPPYAVSGASIEIMLGVKLIPLLIVLPGLLLNRLRAYIWLCFIVLFYFTQSVVEAFLSLGAQIDLVITLVSIGLFISAMWHVKKERARGLPL